MLCHCTVQLKYMQVFSIIFTGVNLQLHLAQDKQYISPALEDQDTLKFTNLYNILIMHSKSYPITTLTPKWDSGILPSSSYCFFTPSGSLQHESMLKTSPLWNSRFRELGPELKFISPVLIKNQEKPRPGCISGFLSTF